MSFLPEGLVLEEDSDNIVETVIVQTDESQPAFKVNVRVLPIKEYRQVFAKLQRQDSGSFRQTNALQDKVDRDYLKRVISSWSGLTVDNWNAIVRDGKHLKVDAVTAEKAKRDGKPIMVDYTEDVAFYLYRNTWPQDFGNKIFDIVQAGAAEQEEEEEQLKKS